MPEPTSFDDLLASTSDAVRGDSTIKSTLADIQRRAEGQTPDRSSAIPASRPIPAPRRMPRQPPPRSVEIRLQNGQRMRAVIEPAPAQRSEVDAIRRASAANDRATFAALQRQRKSFEALRQSYDDLVQKVAALQLQADQSFVSVLQKVGGIDQQVQSVSAQAQTLMTGPASNASLAARQEQALQAQTIAACLDRVTNVVNTMQIAAYGQRGSVFSANNLVLAVNQLFWGLIDPLVKAFGNDPFLQSVGLSTSSPAPGLLAYLAPVGSLVTGYVALGNQQHVRFISGVAVLDGASQMISLRDQIADGLWPEFQRRTDVPVTIVGLDGGGPFAVGEVRSGTLQISTGGGFAIARGGAPPRVAWMIDTGAGVG